MIDGRVVEEPAERWETRLLDRDTLKPVDLGADDMSFLRFAGDGKLLGTRPKPKGEAGEREWVLIDPTAKKTTPLTLPKVAIAEGARVERVLPSPDGKRFLVAWTEEVPAPADWPNQGGPCRAVRLTTFEPDGTKAKTIYEPEVKARADWIKSRWTDLDWR